MVCDQKKFGNPWLSYREHPIRVGQWNLGESFYGFQFKKGPTTLFSRAHITTSCHWASTCNTCLVRLVFNFRKFQLYDVKNTAQCTMGHGTNFKSTVSFHGTNSRITVEIPFSWTSLSTNPQPGKDNRAIATTKILVVRYNNKLLPLISPRKYRLVAALLVYLYSVEAGSTPLSCTLLVWLKDVKIQMDQESCNADS